MAVLVLEIKSRINYFIQEQRSRLNVRCIEFFLHAKSSKLCSCIPWKLKDFVCSFAQRKLILKRSTFFKKRTKEKKK